ncbi:MAG: hypothetical protein VR74_19095 [Hyphomonas sp. BRH_c22]|uniref:DUF3088 family protein n=1 Tax=Hyphomonas sp. BRH_c22 TaxID=1629710 RepID=UPI0005F0EA37|nr:DUF3088 family protein [Hyphomonas sp. BRH_c22]KJS34689.1 MAG: hypothetical protein VR74_19095 [Hyphomonas sp. BRH_c22]
MPKDVLFLLPPGFEGNDRREFCPECAEIWGVLGYFPSIRDALDIVHVGLEHPRTEIVAMLGEGRYNAPTLVLHPDTPVGQDVNVEEANGLRYLASARSIAHHFSHRYGTPFPRGY